MKYCEHENHKEQETYPVLIRWYELPLDLTIQ